MVSISDLMAGLVFIFIITLMIFALTFGRASARLLDAKTARTAILNKLKDRLGKENLVVEIDYDEGILRLTENTINFRRGEWKALPAHWERIDILAKVLSEVLPCFVHDSNGIPCSPKVADSNKYASKIDALLVEGHTDSVRIIGGRLRNNFELSGARATFVLNRLTESKPALNALENCRGRKILSISGYADLRLLEKDPNHANNRRIDLRFLMEPPPNEDASGQRLVCSEKVTEPQIATEERLEEEAQ